MGHFCLLSGLYFSMPYRVIDPRELLLLMALTLNSLLVVLKVDSMYCIVQDQMGTCQKCKFSGPFQMNGMRNFGH